jgi:RNA polymerase sigma-70 factor (ECF subfamily)
LRDARKKERFERLALPELDAVFRTARRIVGSRTAAEEITQDACLKAYANFDPDDEPQAFRPWLFRIAVNCALDYLRHARSEQAICDRNDEIIRGVPDRTLSGQPQAEAEGREIGRAIDRALMMLATETRAVAILVLVEEMTYAEAALALSITEDLVRSRLSRAREDLRGRLSEHAADLDLPSSAPTTRRADFAKRGPQ